MASPTKTKIEKTTEEIYDDLHRMMETWKSEAPKNEVWRDGLFVAAEDMQHYLDRGDLPLGD